MVMNFKQRLQSATNHEGVYPPSKPAFAQPPVSVPQAIKAKDTCHVENQDQHGLEVVSQYWNSVPQALRDHILEQITSSTNRTVPTTPMFAAQGMTPMQGVSFPDAARSQVKFEDPATQPKRKAKGKARVEGCGGPSNTIARKRKDHPTDTSSDDEAWDSMPIQPNLMCSFRVDDTATINKFLYTRFMQIQQSATKIIAKAWIKAICPKKQANYPYVDCNPRHDQPRRRQRHTGPPRIPAFWPDTEGCRHKEPDHIDKYERTHLLMHLVLLGWREQDWFDCNGTSAGEAPGYLKAGAWVKFLRDAFPESRLAELGARSPAKVEQRIAYMKDIYEVAETVEAFREGATAGSYTFSRSCTMALMDPVDAHARRQRSSSARATSRRGSATSKAGSVDGSTTGGPSIAPSEATTRSPKSEEVDMSSSQASPQFGTGGSEELVDLRRGSDCEQDSMAINTWSNGWTTDELRKSESVQSMDESQSGFRTDPSSFPIAMLRPVNNGTAWEAGMQGYAMPPMLFNNVHNLVQAWNGSLAPNIGFVGSPRRFIPGPVKLDGDMEDLEQEIDSELSELPSSRPAAAESFGFPMEQCHLQASQPDMQAMLAIPTTSAAPRSDGEMVFGSFNQAGPYIGGPHLSMTMHDHPQHRMTQAGMMTESTYNPNHHRHDFQHYRQSF